MDLDWYIGCDNPQGDDPFLAARHGGAEYRITEKEFGSPTVWILDAKGATDRYAVVITEGSMWQCMKTAEAMAKLP